LACIDGLQAVAGERYASTSYSELSSCEVARSRGVKSIYWFTYSVEYKCWVPAKNILSREKGRRRIDCRIML
jgi:hypothetical protein